MEGWLSPTMQRDLGSTIDPASGQQPGRQKGNIEDDGSNLRVKASKPGVVQIIKWENREGPFVITVSDSVTYLKATISSAAAAEHLKKTGTRITEGTLGNILQLSEAEIVATHLGPRPSRITLLVSKFKIVGSDKSGQFGSPRPFEATEIGKLLLERLASLGASKESNSRAQSVTQQLDENDPLKSPMEQVLSPDENRLASQQLFSQVPTHLAGLRMSRDLGDTHEQGSINRSKNQSDALLKMLRAKGAAKEPMTGNEAPLQGCEPKAASSPKAVLATGKSDPTPMSGVSSADLSQPERPASTVTMGSPRPPKAGAPSSNSKAVRIRSRDVRIPNDQKKLLDHDHCWLPTEPGQRGPVASIPIAVLQEITRQVEQPIAEPVEPTPQPLSEDRSKEAEDAGVSSEIDQTEDTAAGSPIPSADWPPSSPVQVPRELPPDSSIPIPDSSEDEPEDLPRPTDGTLTDEPASEHNVASVSRRGSVAALVSSPNVPSKKSISPSAQGIHQTSIMKHASPSSAEELVACLSMTESNFRDRNMATACNELGSIESDSELETTVPLRLSEDRAPTPESESTQEVPATAYESQEPVLQVKRTPYGSSGTNGRQNQSNHSASASELYPSPSKRRRMDDHETPQKFGYRAMNLTTQDPSAAARSDSKSTLLAPHFDPNHASGVEDTFLAHAAKTEAAQTSSSVTSPRDAITAPATVQSERPEQGGDSAPQMMSSPIDGRQGLRRKAESPVLSPYVSKRRKVHRSPFAFKFSQDEYPTEDPLFAARKHREEFFASRRSSHTTSHTPLPEVESEKRQSSPTQNTCRLHEDQPIMQEISPKIHRESVARRSGQSSPYVSTERNPIQHKASISDDDNIHKASVSLSHSRSVKTPSPGAERRMVSQSPLMTSVEESDLLLAQSLHGVSSKLEALSSTKTSQQTNISGQAQSLPELMTPALSIADLPQQPSSVQETVTVPQENPAESDIFARFKAQYPDYLGTREHFLGMCRRIHQLSQADRMEHKSLWDDFIIRHKTDYPQYCQRCMETAEDAKSYERFYREEIDEPKYNKRIIQPATLSAVISGSMSAATTKGPVSPAKLKSPNAHSGALSRQSFVAPGRSGHAERSTTSPSGSINARHQSEVLKSKVTIDLTGGRSSSPSSPAAGPLPSHTSTNMSMRPSPRKLPWRAEGANPRSPLSEKERRDQARNNGSLEQDQRQVAPFRSVTATPLKKAKASAKRESDSTKRGVAVARTSDVGAVKAPKSTQSSRPQRIVPQSGESSAKTSREPAVPDAGHRSQPKQPTGDVDEWWKDENTPFREFSRMYQSITPGRGNAWANEKAREITKGKKAESGALISTLDLPPSNADGLIVMSPPGPRRVEDDDPRFSVRFAYGETELSVTHVLMNAVELSARYAELDFQSRVPQRHGIVLPTYPQVEIAVIPAPPATSVQVRLVIWAIYAAVLDMVYNRPFRESEIEVRWDDQVKAHMFFTQNMDDDGPRNDPRSNRTARPALISSGGKSNTTSPSPSPSPSSASAAAVNAEFSWLPIYKPNGLTLAATDVFLLALGAIKTLATFGITDKVLAPFHIGSEVIDVHLEIWPRSRRQPRPLPPFMRYGSVLEAVRRIPGWELERRRFAEFFCSLEALGRGVGVVLMEKGPVPLAVAAS
ncbi:MAG: hypothetical protein Q9207_006372 [Kuettlingeria erythrocarpa]